MNEMNELLPESDEAEYLIPAMNTERLYLIINYHAQHDSFIMVDEIFDEDRPFIDQLLAQGRIKKWRERHGKMYGETYYLPTTSNF